MICFEIILGNISKSQWFCSVLIISMMSSHFTFWCNRNVSRFLAFSCIGSGDRGWCGEIRISDGLGYSAGEEAGGGGGRNYPVRDATACLTPTCICIFIDWRLRPAWARSPMSGSLQEIIQNTFTGILLRIRYRQCNEMEFDYVHTKETL